MNQALTSLGTEIMSVRTDHLASNLDMKLFKAKVNSQIFEVLRFVNLHLGQILDMKMTRIRCTTDLACKIYQDQASLTTQIETIGKQLLKLYIFSREIRVVMPKRR